MLDLDGATTGEAVRVLHEAEGVPEVKRTGVNTKAIGGASVAVEGGGGGLLGGGRKGHGRCGGGGEDSELYGWIGDDYF